MKPIGGEDAENDDGDDDDNDEDDEDEGSDEIGGSEGYEIIEANEDGVDEE